MMNNKPIRAAVLGASGYSGQELLLLLKRHPRIRAAWATSESERGGAVPGVGLQYVRAEDVPLGAADVVFTCLPHGAAAAWSLAARNAGARVVDLSSDLRAGGEGAVYGLPELWRAEVRGSDLVANPGCYPTGILVALAPLLATGLVDTSRPLVVNAASGVTGAGRAARRDLLFGEVAEDYRAYGAGNTHRHVPEIIRGLERLAGGPVPVVFTPHLLPVRRGILETMYVPLRDGTARAAALEAWGSAYADEPFIDVWPEGLPSLRGVVGRNTLALGACGVDGIAPPVLLVVAAFDNLVKGAAGQAVQNANLMMDLCENEGLPQ
jgi:N-acetyl-gamma-glutamyl-phosphate reductase